MADLYERLELELPGTWIDHADREYAWTVQPLLNSAIDQFNDAIVACQLFEPFDYEDLKGVASGEVFRSDPVRDRLRGICARAYVYALHAACSYIKAAKQQPLNAPPVVASCDALLQRFKGIDQIRHSLAHVEERSQGKGYGGKELRGPLLVIGGSFIGSNRFGLTSGDGRYVEVEISEGFLSCFRSALRRVLWSFEWLVVGNIRAQRPSDLE